MECKHRGLRPLVALCLSLLFSFSTLAGFAAQSFSSAASAMECCPMKGKCCCRKHHSDNGPELSAKTCIGNCTQVTLGGIVSSGFTPLQAGAWMPLFDFAGPVSFTEYFASARISSHQLQQRPPPPISLA